MRCQVVRLSAVAVADLRIARTRAMNEGDEMSRACV
jgi:hypothetical protein